ncbi:tetratricopeptide repeat protein [Flammeovirga kamogawensis]|uniref:Tetratricopeptide repeat protein n=1 Tax=Flammeovirga kamogawensis TaxID=373891 RepID=A0ABX8GR72_9BACT|nr:tetratricopeptide repeat protein [Flammeovirga kamogawensis]MBB6462691.1 TolA-binding protein [Flammeovirga kamogawensis]QWG06073.1 tetratricopeptide repeat protein [Flammeovirga kamogawensis]
MKDKKHDTAKKGNTSEEHSEFEVFESAEVLQDRLEESQDFFDKNKNAILIAVGVVVAAVAGYFLYGVNLEKQNTEAQAELAPAVFYFEKDSLGKALNGDGNLTGGFLEIADEYSGTKAANLATYYAGVSYMKMGEYAKAITHLDAFSAKDELVQARAYALVGDANVELEKYPEAISSYKEAIAYKQNKEFTPSYMMKLAFTYEAAGDNAKALDTYNDLLAKYPKVQEANDAKKYAAILAAK